MTTGFQHQHTSFGPILKTAAKPQHLGAKIKPAEDSDAAPALEKRTFSKARPSR